MFQSTQSYMFAGALDTSLVEVKLFGIGFSALVYLRERGNGHSRIGLHERVVNAVRLTFLVLDNFSNSVSKT